MRDAATATKLALIYTRVSRDLAEGRSPAEQEAECRAVCRREGWEVLEVVTDSVGASRHSTGTRSGWARARQVLAAGKVDVLCTWESSRAQRDLAAYAELRDLCAEVGVLWSYKGRTHDLTKGEDRFTTGLDALLAEREADEISERVSRAMRANAAQGRPHGRRLFGYRRVYDKNTGLMLGQEPDPDEAAVVRRIFEQSLAGVGIRTIAARLNDDGHRTSTGAMWQDTQVRRVLSNPAYAGRRRHHGKIVADATWEPLVDPSTFDRMQARFEQRRATMTRTVGTARLLTGVLRCGKCGGKMACGHDRGNRKQYQCRHGFHVARDMVKLDEFVSTVIVERLSRPDVAAALSEPEDSGTDLEEARAKVQELTARLDEAVDSFASGQISASTLAKIEQRLRREIEEAEKACREVLTPIDLDVPDNVAQWWEEMSPELRREVVNSLLASVTVLPVKKPGGRTFEVDSVVVEWRR